MTAKHDGEVTPADERRRWTRTTSDLSEVTVICGDRHRTAAVIDESFGGIGIKLAEISDIVRGNHLKLLYRGIPVSGIVRRVRQDEDGHRVGLEWLSNGRSEFTGVAAGRRRTAQFISFSGFCVVCRTETGRPDGRLSATLPDGSSCVVSVDDLRTRTVDQRRAELETLTLDLTMLSGIYQLGTHANKESRIEAILDYEFRQQTDSVTDLIEQLRRKNKTILDQSQRIEELESYLACIVGLAAKVRELELELETTA